MGEMSGRHPNAYRTHREQAGSDGNVHVKRRAHILAIGTMLALALTSCGTSATKSPRLRVSRDNNCGSAYFLTSRTTQVGTQCGGVIGYPPLRVTLKLGEHFEVSAAANLGSVHFPALDVHGSAIRRASSDGSSVTYVAVEAGRAALVAKGVYCQKSSKDGCVAFELVVS